MKFKEKKDIYPKKAEKFITNEMHYKYRTVKILYRQKHDFFHNPH